MLFVSLPWAAMICATVSKTLPRTPWLLQERQKPLCTMGRVPMHFRPRFGGWSARQVCNAGMPQQPHKVMQRAFIQRKALLPVGLALKDALLGYKQVPFSACPMTHRSTSTCRTLPQTARAPESKGEADL